MSNIAKWRIRKQCGLWQVWRPNETTAIIEFPSFDALLGWTPDCERFLKGYCHCRTGCAR